MAVISFVGLELLLTTILPITRSDYYGAIIDKHERAKNLECGRILLVGGSNLAFGIDSRRLEEALEMPTVNFGIHSGLGLNFILNEAKDMACEGDIVLLSIEYLLDLNGHYEYKKLASMFCPDAKKYYQILPTAELEFRIRTLRKRIKSFHNIIKPDNSIQGETSVYNRRAFNEYGDIVAHIGRTKRNRLRGNRIIKYRYWEGIDKLNNFSEWAGNKGIQVLLSYPPYPKTSFEKNKASLWRHFDDMERDLFINSVNTPTDLIFHDSLFFDTVNHLTDQGRVIRTSLLIKGLSKKLNDNKQ